MREIKFRAWTGLKMEYDIIVGKFGAFYVNPFNNGIDPKDSASLTTCNTKYSDTTPIMQFTGLLDKNGKEIYEGDIVKKEDGTKWVITWKNYAWFRCNLGNDGHGRSFPDDTYGEYFVDDNALDSEVIGNIYENPELLEVKDVQN